MALPIGRQHVAYVWAGAMDLHIGSSLPLRVECPVDGLNRRVPFDAIAEAFAPTNQAYRLANAREQFSLSVIEQDDSAVWLLDQIKR